jgi:glutamate/tyrosine decarboxylase-like PLP-dependent enzyme
MNEPDWKDALGEAFEESLAYLQGLPSRPIASHVDLSTLRAALGGALPELPVDPRDVVADLVDAADQGLMASGSGRFFGFVVGGANPAALAADWLASTWDQNAGLYVLGPAASVVEEIAGEWLAELFGLPAGVSVGYVTGGQMANFTGLAAGLHDVLRRAGWDLATGGLWGAPRVRILAGAGRHGTIDRALRFLGVGTHAIVEVDADDQGRMRPAALAAALEQTSGPAIVCAQIGNVNSGSIDPVAEICALSREHGAWVHVDGAFGLWASASPQLRPLVAGVELADSWATDAHKWLNVPYDCGVVLCREPEHVRSAMAASGAYLLQAAAREPYQYTPDFSRRARGVEIWAALAALGRRGLADLVEGTCRHAARFADGLRVAGYEVLNDVVLNQVLVAFGDDETTRRVASGLQAEGTCWCGTTVWQGRTALRISVSSWATTAADVEASLAAMIRVAAHVRGGR